MCDFCDRAKSSDEYKALIGRMMAEDAERLAFTKSVKDQFSFIKAYSSVDYPVKLVYPMFEARTAFAIPANYFQQLSVDGEVQGANFAHGAMRSVFFAGKKLMLFSRNVSHTEGKEFFNSFLLAHFEPNEYKTAIEGESVTISVDVEKPARNLVTGKTQKIKIRFNFTNPPVKNRIVSRESVMTSAQLKTVYGKYAGLDKRMASVDMEGYAITVPHFSPHPYMIQLCKEFGYAEPRAMQEHVIDYFRAHLG